MKKVSKTIEEQLKERKYKIPTNLEWLAYGFLSHLPFFEPKYNVHYDVIDNPSDCKGPCFIVWNHQSRRDYLFLKVMLGKKKFNMVAGYSEFSRKKFVWLFKHARVLPKKNFTQDMNGIRAITSIIKQGGCVAFSPEGSSSVYGCQQPNVPGTGKFLKFFKVPVYFMHLEGAYLTSHKVSIEDRPGRIDASIRLLFSQDDLNNLTPEQIDDKLHEVMWHDDYEWNKTARVKYKTKHNACNRLDDIIYKCPKCGEELFIEAKGDKIYCKNCGNGASIDDYYDVHPFDENCKIPVSPSMWVAWQRMEIIKEIRNDPNYSFSVKCKIGELPKYKPIKKNNVISILCGEGTITFDHNGIHFDGIKNNQEWRFDLSYQNYYTLLVENETDVFSFYVNGEYYDFIPEQKVVGKCILLTEEMHRLHFNIWKNYPWNSYMYHGTELEVPNDDYEEKVKKIFL